MYMYVCIYIYINVYIYIKVYIYIESITFVVAAEVALFKRQTYPINTKLLVAFHWLMSTL